MESLAFDAKLPIRLTLAESEVTSLEAPPPLYVLLHRLSYLPTLSKTALEYFQAVLPPGDNRVWFEYRGLPLRWQVPAGVLYDLFCGITCETPWPLTVHFRSFPQETLLPWEGDSSLRSAFMNSLKEAACISRGSAARVMEMGSAAQEQLWSSLVDCPRRESYGQVLRSLQLDPERRGTRPPCVPVRVYVNTSAQGHFPSYSCLWYTSRPLEAQQQQRPGAAAGMAGSPGAAGTASAAGGFNGGPRYPTLREVLEPLLEEGGCCAASSSSGGDASSRERSSSSKDGNAAAAAAAGEGSGVGRGGMLVGSRVLVGGVDAPLDAPVAWLHARLHALDYFLYVVVLLGAAEGDSGKADNDVT